jgi:hypothetical protein
VEDKELVLIALNGFTPSWKSLVQGVCVCENYLFMIIFGMSFCKNRSCWNPIQQRKSK